MEFNYFSIPVITATALMFLMGFMIRPYRTTPGVRYFSLLMFAGGLYSLLYALELSSGDPLLIHIFFSLQYLVIPFIPALFLIFATGYSRKTDISNTALLLLIFLVPVLTALFAVTNNLHGFFIREWGVDETGPFPLAVFEPGTWYWVYQVFTSAAILAGIVLIFRMYLTSAPAFRRQVGIVLAGALFPFIIYLIYLGGAFPRGLDANPFSFSVTGMIIFFGISRFRLFSYAPLARNFLFDNMPGGVIVLDMYFRVVDMNRSAAAILKIDPEDTGRSADEVFEKWPEIIENMTGVNSRNSFGISRITGDRTLFLECIFSPLIDDKNMPKGQMLVIHDVTAQKKADNERHRIEEKFRIIFENAPVALMYFDKEARIELCNDYFLQIHDSDMENILGTNIRDLNDNRINELLDRTFSGQKVVFEGEYKPGKGTRTVFVSGIFKPLISRSNIVEGGLCILEDITRRKMAEARIKNANEELKRLNAEKDRFFSILAHDLRSPFSAFLGFTDILEENINKIPAASARKIISAMKESANNLYGLLENLLQWSSMHQGLVKCEPGQFELLDKVQESLEPLMAFARNKKIIVSYDIPADMTVFADSKMFETIIRNLFTNAVKFTPKSGRIMFSAKHSSNDHIEICCCDTGIGMSPTILENLFRLDAKTSRPGTDGELSTGLGLILVKEFIEMHKGGIRIESELNKGSRFYVRLKKSGMAGNSL
jgi:PAS domain S-box-containing protein